MMHKTYGAAGAAKVVLICLGDGLGLLEVPCVTARYVPQSSASLTDQEDSPIHGYSPSRLHA
jgi:hypothetical protein